MPTYEYQCKNCGHVIEELQSMSEAPLVQCPKCKKDRLVRVMGTGGVLIFKGTGFYKTDYKKEGEGSKGKPKKPADSSDKGGKGGKEGSK